MRTLTGKAKRFAQRLVDKRYMMFVDDTPEDHLEYLKKIVPDEYAAWRRMIHAE